MEIKLNRTCKVNGGNKVYEAGEVISGPACVVDILLRLGYAEIVAPVRETEVNEETEE